MSHFSVIVGLGNPGPQYQNTRHNLGFMLVDALIRLVEEEGQRPTWRDRFSSHLCQVEIGGESVWVMKPQGFMNRSGAPVAELLGFYKIDPSLLVAAYDDVELPLGRIRLRQGGSDGGHNGVKSLIDALGCADFTRLKLGIGRPSSDALGKELSPWVLGAFSDEERAHVGHLIARGVQALKLLCSEGLRAAQNTYNSKGEV